MKINEALCYSSNHTYHHFANPPSSSSSSNNNKRGGNYNSTDKINVQQVAFVNAEIKLVKSLINGVSIDVSCNQIGALYGQALIERLDELVSQDHLLKRSILLIKQWCQVDAVAFCGAAGSAAGSLGGGLLGAKDGRLSTWSLVIMILHIFRSHSAVLKVSANIFTSSTLQTNKQQSLHMYIHPHDLIDDPPFDSTRSRCWGSSWIATANSTGTSAHSRWTGQRRRWTSRPSPLQGMSSSTAPRNSWPPSTALWAGCAAGTRP